LPATQPVIKINKINKNYLGIDDELNYQYHILADTSRRRNVIIQDLK
jgi:hypothetical protein